MWRRFHESGDAVVVHVDLRPDADRETEALAWLDAAEHVRRGRFLRDRPRREFTLCRAALRALLCKRLACGNTELCFETSEHGKPLALVDGVPTPADFSVSHSGGHGLIAFVPEGRIGVDVEERSARRDLAGDIKVLFAPEERAALGAAEGDLRIDLFYRLWTLKEALVKATGAGLSLDTAGFEIPPALYGNARGRATHCEFRHPGVPGAAWRLETLGNGRFAAALARELPKRG